MTWPEIARRKVAKVLAAKKLIGPDRGCPYYPCHFDGQDCTWCFCPFYPCLDESTGGRYVVGRYSGRLVWSCERCSWVHRPEVAKAILEEILSAEISRPEEAFSKIKQVFQRIKKRFPPP